jgi:hypothetical protein
MDEHTRPQQLALDFSTRITGLCECGCGQATKLAKGTCRAKGWVKGQPKRFVNGHQGRIGNRVPPPVERRYFGPEYREEDRGYTSPCWIWQHRIHNGYGVTTQRRTNGRAHKIYYEAVHGPVPRGLELDHRCRQKCCVHPDHLEAVTHTENMRRSSATRLTAEQALAIYLSTDLRAVLAERYDISVDQVKQILARREWRDVTEGYVRPYRRWGRIKATG